MHTGPAIETDYMGGQNCFNDPIWWGRPSAMHLGYIVLNYLVPILPIKIRKDISRGTFITASLFIVPSNHFKHTVNLTLYLCYQHRKSNIV
jgi:hypothetical protein